MDADVLIVGAGPTGLMLANQLGRRGIQALIIDRHSGPAQQTRAMAVHARTLEIYSKLGIAERALELGQRGNGANMWAGGKRRARIPLGDIGKSISPFPFVLMLGQDDNERIMGDHLRHWGMAVQWNTELIALEQQTGHVTATLKLADGSTRRVTAAYVAGCDGGHSTVRELNGIGFPGEPYEHVFFVADTEATGPMVKEELNVYLWRDGFHLFFPMRGTDRWRVIGILPRHLRERNNLSFDDAMPAIRQEAGADLSFKSCSWFSTYRIHHRRAERFRDRRCFLLGDAAHVHSPMGGQGMNTGLQDAYNLAWKLALVVLGRADTALLDSYEAERLPVAQRLLDTTDRAFRLVVSDAWIAGIFRRRIIARIAAFVMTREWARKLAFRTLSQTGIHYRNSPLSQNLAGLPNDAPRAGDRFPWLRLRFQANGPVEDLFQKLDDTCFNLIVIGQPAPSELMSGPGDLLRTHVIPDDAHNARELAGAHIPLPAFYLLRPDGHVGLAGIRLEAAAVTHYLSWSRIRSLKVTPVTAAPQPARETREMV
ncbi:MAG: FAD-dependent monooxygenase [Sulfuricaulis sp.]